MATKVSNSSIQSVSASASAKSGGSTKFATSVIETIAGIAAREIPGVFQLGGGSLSRAAARVTGTAGTSHGVKAEVGKKEVAIDLEMIVEYGYNVHDVAREVRALVAARLEQMTGLFVKEVNIHVADIEYSPDEPESHTRVE